MSLEPVSRDLQAIGEGRDILSALGHWQAGFDRDLAVRLRRGEARSLYDRERLARALR